MNDVDLVFIGGAPRSGTTLVRRILGAHPRVYAGPEFDVVPDLVRLRDQMCERVRIGRISAIVDGGGVDAALGGALRGIFAAKAAREGADIFCEKTPANVAVFPQLLEMFPDARLVLALRDPRAVAASMKEVARKYRAEGDAPPPFVRDVRASALEINRLLAPGFAALAAAPDRVTAVHYEDLVADPEPVVRRLCERLGLDFAPEMLRPEEVRQERPEGAAAAEVSRWYTPAQFARPIEADRLEAWRDTLTPAEIGLVEALVTEHPLLARYRLKATRPPAATRLLSHRLKLRRGIARAGRAVARRLAE